MLAFFLRPYRLLILLMFWTAIPAVVSAVMLVQFPAGTLPDDLRYIAAPATYWSHALAGVLFSVLGPLQFVRALKSSFGAVHRLAGWVFVLSGAVLGGSGLSLLIRVDTLATPLIDAFRIFAGIGLIVALGLSLRAAMARDLVTHRAWMIRAYAIGVGSGTVAIVMLPLVIAHGKPPTGILADLVFLGSWVATILTAEWVIRQSQPKRPDIYGRRLRSIPMLQNEVSWKL